MTAVVLPVSFHWPYQGVPPLFTQNLATLDAAGEIFAMIGKIHMNGKAASKTLDTTGSSSIQFQTSGANVFDTAGSVFKVGIMGVLTATGPIATPDEATGYSVVGTFTQGTNNTSPALTTGNAWTTAVPTSGTATISHGDMIAVVFELTTNNGSESIVIAGCGVGDPIAPGFPITNSKIGAGPSWQSSVTGGAGQYPNVVLVMSDGTLATLEGTQWLGLISSTSWATGGTDEKGMIFQVPWDCKVDALIARVRTAGATSDFTVSLYSDPFGTPAVMNSGAATVAVLAEQYSAINTANLGTFPIAEVSLSANTNYCVAVKADGAGNIRFEQATIGDAAHRKLFSPAGDVIGATSRNTGAFAAIATPPLLYPVGVRIVEISGFGGGGGGMVMTRLQLGM